MKKQREPHPLKTTATGALWAVILIPFIPVLIPLLLFYYLGQMVDIIKRGPK